MPSLSAVGMETWEAASWGRMRRRPPGRRVETEAWEAARRRFRMRWQGTEAWEVAWVPVGEEPAGEGAAGGCGRRRRREGVGCRSVTYLGARVFSRVIFTVAC
ncbi:hypothetical protein BS78_08G070700 [Paspalum vaginatum]|nr:hypothetical protein BS78_08G070700 [Paspalum vaginatum]